MPVARIQSVPAGTTRREPTEGDLVVVHLSAPVVADCRIGRLGAGPREQRRGDIDVVPAGIFGQWQDDGAVRLLVLTRDRRETANRLWAALGLRDRALGQVCAAIESELAAPDPDQLLVDDLACAALLRLERLQDGAGDRREASRLGAAIRRRLDDHIRGNLGARLDLPGLAGVAGMSVSAFTQAFRAEFGSSPHRYVLRRRLERAKELIQSGDSLIAEIAHSCGFSSQSHLTRHFHGVSSLTPGAMRKALRG